MKITFLGVGEAFDETLPNNSHLLESKSANLLIDCGYSVPQEYWKRVKDPNFLDAIWISHQHADHFFGLPIIAVRLWEDGRTKPLTIFCQEESKEYFKEFIDAGYNNFIGKFKYDINFRGVRAGQNVDFMGLSFSFAPTVHSAPNLAIKISDGKGAYCYSGDGQFTKETEALYHNANLLIQETYLYDEGRVGHSCIKDALAMAEKQGIKSLALTHMQREFRKKEFLNIKDSLNSEKVHILVPEPGQEFSFS